MTESGRLTAHELVYLAVTYSLHPFAATQSLGTIREYLDKLVTKGWLTEDTGFYAHTDHSRSRVENLRKIPGINTLFRYTDQKLLALAKLYRSDTPLTNKKIRVGSAWGSDQNFAKATNELFVAQFLTKKFDAPRPPHPGKPPNVWELSPTGLQLARELFDDPAES